MTSLKSPKANWEISKIISEGIEKSLLSFNSLLSSMNWEKQDNYFCKAWLSNAAAIPGHGIYEHLSPNHNVSQVLTAGLPVKLSWVRLHRQAGRFCMWTSFGTICGCNVWRNNLIFSTTSYFQNGVWSISRQFEYVCDPSQMRPASLWNRSPNVVSCNRRLRHR